MSELIAHVFICTHTKDGRESCGAKGSADLRDALKKMSKEEKNWKDKVRINASGCLGHCDEGIACVIYPKAKWLLELERNDEAKIVKAINKILDKAED